MYELNWMKNESLKSTCTNSEARNPIDKSLDATPTSLNNVARWSSHGNADVVSGWCTNHTEEQRKY